MDGRADTPAETTRAQEVDVDGVFVELLLGEEVEIREKSRPPTVAGPSILLSAAQSEPIVDHRD